MRKLAALLLVFVMLFALTACGGGSTEVTKESTSVTASSSSNSESSSTSTDSSSSPAAISTDETVEEQVLLDESGIKITLKDLDKGAMTGPKLNMLFENNSGKDITVQVRNLSVNGYMIDSIMSVDVVNGKKANETLTLMESDLKTAGISTIADIEFSFHIVDASSWDGILDSAPIVIKTSAADGYNFIFDDSGNVAYEDWGMKIVIKGLAEDSSVFGPSIVVFIENNSDTDFTAQVRDVSVNGFMVDPIFSSDVVAGKRCIDTITFRSSQLEENDITEVESVELSFHVFTGWDTIVDTEPITINF